MSIFDRNVRSARFYYGLMIGCGVAVEVMQALFLVHAFGFYASEWIKEFGWSNAAIAIAFSIYRGGTGLLAPVQGVLLDRVGPRRLMFAGILAFGCGYALLSQVRDLWVLYLVFALLAVGGSLSGPTAIMTVLINWFARRQAAVIALTQMGFGFSSLVVPAMALSMALWGWRITALASGLAILLIGLPICLVVRNRPEDRGLRPYGSESVDEELRDGAGKPSRSVSREFQSVSEVMRLPSFWLLSGGHAVALVFIGAVTVYLVPFLTVDLRLDEQRAAWIVLTVGVFTMVGQLALTVVEGFFSRKGVLAGALLSFHAATLALLSFANSFNQVLVIAAAYGFFWGARGPLQHALRVEYFGRALFARLSGIALTISMAGMVFGPIVGGVITDLIGSYRQGFLVLSLVGLLSGAMFGLAKKPE